jgi:glycine/D-amino acid oxidase-like deaminating enzyme
LDPIDADYLVIGAGATGMAFADALIADSDASVVLADRRHAPGGHWNNAYPFVRLHQPSTFYGVNSLSLDHDRIDRSGLNAGFYEQAGGPAICDYFQRALDGMLSSGQVDWRGGHEYVGRDDGGHRLWSRITGQETAIRARKVVDATYLNTEVPARHEPGFEVDRPRASSPRVGWSSCSSPPTGSPSWVRARRQWTSASGFSPNRSLPRTSGGCDHAMPGRSTVPLRSPWTWSRG